MTHTYKIIQTGNTAVTSSNNIDLATITAYNSSTAVYPHNIKAYTYPTPKAVERCSKCNSTFVHVGKFDDLMKNSPRIVRCMNCDHREEKWDVVGLMRE